MAFRSRDVLRPGFFHHDNLFRSIGYLRFERSMVTFGGALWALDVLGLLLSLINPGEANSH
jgi:hypothetical protein